MSWYDSEQEEDEPYTHHVSARKRGRPMGHDAPHYPNSSERALLVKLMRDGQCSEAEVRSRKENRQALAKAALEPMAPSGKREEYKLKMRKRHIAHELGVLVTDPIVMKTLNERMTNSSGKYTYRGYYSLSRFFR
jgi:hypothetical protein